MKPSAKSAAAAKLLTIRIQSSVGMKRLELSPSSTFASLQSKVQELFGLPSNRFALYRDRAQTQPVSSQSTLSAAKINHGDILYLPADLIAPSMSVSNSSTSLVSSTSSATLEEASTVKKASLVKLDEVDEFLLAQDGKIERKRDEKYCRHGTHSKCVHCAPLDPYDEEYLLQREIKHMSFHAYLRKVLGDQLQIKALASTLSDDKNKISFPQPLENITCRIKPGCSSHPPWPAGICTKCQPNTVTLNRQRYRHVDNISFENQFLVNRFLDGWRRSGTQRVGLLIGRYEPYLDVPLGIRAVVAAIYEPPQRGTANSVEFLEDPDKQTVEELVAALGMCMVGWMFTDLTDEGGGHVAYTRNIDSYLLSAEECVTAGKMQSERPNPCRFASDGVFGSKFVTVVVTGDREHQVQFEGYQVSNQCMALVRDQCLVPTLDAPELAYVKESSNEQYVPDVFFKEKDQYGNDSQRIGRPLPVEYLIIDVPAGMPREPEFSFVVTPNTTPFPVENRLALAGIGFAPDELREYWRQFTRNQFYELAADFHFLLFLCLGEGQFGLDELRPLLEALMSRDRAKAFDWAQVDARWERIESLMAAGGLVNGAMAASASGGESWSCDHCTYLNDATRADCEMCGLPRRG